MYTNLYILQIFMNLWAVIYWLSVCCGVSCRIVPSVGGLKNTRGTIQV